MDINGIKDLINNNPSQFTIKYATKLLERVNILIEKEVRNSDLEKYTFLKTLASDICFSCELLLKSKINDYNNGNDFATWKTHNLLQIFNSLNLNDQNFLCNKLHIDNAHLQIILQDSSTSDAFIKRYLYEEDTGIPNYAFLCDFANALIELNGEIASYDFKKIDILSEDFDTAQFSYTDVIKTHSDIIYRKSKIFDLNEFEDDETEYIVRNMKSCDFAFFSELRFKYFDKNHNPKKEHEFSQLHKRLSDACSFLVGKGQYMRQYMNKNSTVDFRWALESLMFNENFNAGDTLKEIYADLNITFDRSRFCTTEYFENYYNSLDFAETIKNITDLLIMNEDKANKIIENKEQLIKNFGIEFLVQHGFSVEEMQKIDINYLIELSRIQNITYFPKFGLLESNTDVQDKIKYFITQMPNYYKIPSCIDYIVNKDSNNSYYIDMDKYNASIAFDNLYLHANAEKINQYIQLSKVINDSDMIIKIIENKLDFNLSTKRYIEMQNKCKTLSKDKQLVNSFIEEFGMVFVENGQIEKMYKYFSLYKFFFKEEHGSYFCQFDNIIKLSDLSFEKIIYSYSLFKKYNLQDMFFSNIDVIKDIEISDLNLKLNEYKKNEEILHYYKNEANFLNRNYGKLADFLKNFNKETETDQDIDLDYFNAGKVEETYELLKSKNLLYLYKNIGLVNVIENNATLNTILNSNFIQSINKNDKDEEDLESVGILIRQIFENKVLKDILMDLSNTSIVMDHAKTLRIFESNYSTLENVYRLNIYNNWYNKVKNNNISCNGAKLDLPSDRINEISELLVNTIANNYYQAPEKKELSTRLESLFANSQLVYSMNKKILEDYDIEFMNYITKESKFKYKDFSNYNYFGNLFETIRSNNLDKEKIMNLLNTLYKNKKNSNIINFIQKLCNCQKKDILTTITFNDQSTSMNFDDNLLDYLNTQISTKNETELSDYLNTIDIKIDEPFYDTENIYNNYNNASFDKKRRLGLEVLEYLKDTFAHNALNFKNHIVSIISNSYISSKLKIYKIKKEYNKNIERENDENESEK